MQVYLYVTVLSTPCILLGRDTVMRVMRDVDPNGSSLRKYHRLQKRKYRCNSLVPSPTPSFSSLAVRYCKRRKAGRGTGNEATVEK